MAKNFTMLKFAAVLLCLVLITTHFTTGLYARYATSASAEDGARVASFKIDTDLDHIQLGTTPGVSPTFQLGGDDETDSITIPFYIESSAEVAVGYSVTVNFGTALPDYMSVTLTCGTNSRTINGNNAMSVFTFADFGTMAPAGATAQRQDITLTISVSDLTEITDEVTIPTAELTVRVLQLD